jgi:hypothetical protein
VTLYRDGDEVEVLAEPSMGGVLVFTGQTRVTSYIRVQDGGELTGQTVFHTEVPFIESGRSGE